MSPAIQPAKTKPSPVIIMEFSYRISSMLEKLKQNCDTQYNQDLEKFEINK
jgi:hypothetical protein